MVKPQFVSKHKEILDSFLLKNPLVTPGKMFGHPAYYVGGKLFASLYMEGVCVKIPEDLVKKLIKKDGIIPFEPMGKKMKAWVQINRPKSDDYLKDKEIFDESIKYVAKLANIEINKK